MRRNAAIPVAEIPMPWVRIAAFQGMLAVAAPDGLRFYDGAGSELDRISLVLPRFDYLRVHGALLYGWHRHGMTPFLIADGSRGHGALWNPTPPAVLPRMAPGPTGSVLVLDGQRAWLVSPEGSARALPLPLAGEERCWGACALGDGLVLEVSGGAIESWHVRHLALDGTERWRAPGYQPMPLRAGLALIHRGVDVLDAQGRATRVASMIPSPRAHGVEWFAPLDDDWLCAKNERVIRMRPDGAVLWSTATSTTGQLTLPEVAGGVVAAACSEYSSDKHAYVFDARSGRLLHQLGAPAAIRAVVALGPEAIALSTYSKKVYAWTSLSARQPERFILPHDERVVDVRSPAPGVLVTQLPDRLLFWNLAGR